jgi:hypothetical protein
VGFNYPIAIFAQRWSYRNELSSTMKLLEMAIDAVYFVCYVPHAFGVGAIAMRAKPHDAVVYAASLAHLAHPIALPKWLHVGRGSIVGIHLRAIGNGYGEVNSIRQMGHVAFIGKCKVGFHLRIIRQGKATHYFCPMRMLLIFLLALLVWPSCKTAAPPQDITLQREAKLQRFQLLVHFRGLEGLKRIPYKFAHLRMEIGQEVSQQPLVVVLSISCTAQERDGFIAKLSSEADIVSIRPYE